MIVEKSLRSDLLEQFQAAANANDRAIAAAFMEAVAALRDRVTDADIEAAYARGGVTGVLNLFDDGVLTDSWQALAAALAAATLSGAEIAAVGTPAVTGIGGTRVNFVFNATNPAVAGYARQNIATRIRELSDDVRAVTRDVMVRQITAGVNPRAAARVVRDAIGLTARQELAVANFRHMLETGDRALLSRLLRDKRFDPTLRRLISGDVTLSPDKTDRMVERYRQRYLRYRSEMIARTETTTAIEGGQHALFESYIDDGLIDRSQIRRTWIYTKDEKTRAAHRAIPRLNPGGVGQDEPFKTPLGPMRFPGDPNGAAENRVHCRCHTFVRIRSIGEN